MRPPLKWNRSRRRFRKDLFGGSPGYGTSAAEVCGERLSIALPLEAGPWGRVGRSQLAARRAVG